MFLVGGKHKHHSCVSHPGNAVGRVCVGLPFPARLQKLLNGENLFGPRNSNGGGFGYGAEDPSFQHSSGVEREVCWQP